jgi:endonuclease YncB( thermonuclease family)
VRHFNLKVVYLKNVVQSRKICVEKGGRLMSFLVTSVTDGDTFEVSPAWKWENESGKIVRPLGYNTPEIGAPGYREAKEKLERLILDKYVDLKNVVKITYGRLLCDVFYNGKNLADYFPEYQ